MKLAFVLLPKYSMIAFASLIEPIRLTNRESGEADYIIQNMLVN